MNYSFKALNRAFRVHLVLFVTYVTASEFIEWAMTQPEVRDQCDALFIGNELLTRGVFLPVSYGEEPHPPRPTGWNSRPATDTPNGKT